MGNSNQYIQDTIRGLIGDIRDFNSPLYQQYAAYLRGATPLIGVNTLLAPLLAGGAGYAGGRQISEAKALELERMRQDTINQGILGFTGQMQSYLPNYLGILNQNYLGNLDYDIKMKQVKARRQSGLGSLLGTILGIGASLIPGVGPAGLAIGSAVGGAIGAASGGD